MQFLFSLRLLIKCDILCRVISISSCHQRSPNCQCGSGHSGILCSGSLREYCRYLLRIQMLQEKDNEEVHYLYSLIRQHGSAVYVGMAVIVVCCNTNGK